MNEYDQILDMMMTAMERRGTRLVEDPNPGDIVLERTALQHAVVAGFRSRECVRCDGEFHAIGEADRVCGFCVRKTTNMT